MRYFTPELFRRLNSPDPEEVDAAAEEWERAVARYDRKLKRIRKDLPESVRHFLDDFYMHDADLFGPARPSTPALAPHFHVAWLFARLPGSPLVPENLVVLEYRLIEEPAIERSDLPDALCSAQPTWLYDEFDRLDRAVFSHEIFASNGDLIRLKFVEFRCAKAEVASPIRRSSPPRVPLASP